MKVASLPDIAARQINVANDRPAARDGVAMPYFLTRRSPAILVARPVSLPCCPLRGWGGAKTRPACFAQVVPGMHFGDACLASRRRSPSSDPARPSTSYRGAARASPSHQKKPSLGICGESGLPVATGRGACEPDDPDAAGRRSGWGPPPRRRSVSSSNRFLT